MTGPAQSEDCVIATRGDVRENTHQVHAAIVDSTGRLLYAVGNPSRVTLMRSAAKPAQALAVLSTGCFEKCGFDEVDLALMCASHNSEQRHVDRARSMLVKAGVTEDDLNCGGHPSISSEVNRSWIRADFEPTPINNNCSGKHAGMLAGSKALGGAIETYHLPGNPLQTEVKRVVEQLADLEPASVFWSTDGCNLPAPAVPLQSMAQVYAKFATAADAADKDDTQTARMSQIFHAMSTYPEMVAGKDRFCTTLMKNFHGRLIGKVGADGCYGIGIRASEQTRRLGSAGAIGIAIKIEDGNLDVLYSVAAEILARLHVEEYSKMQDLRRFHQLSRLNTANEQVGCYCHAYSLRPCTKS
ncbi:hypothetical protein M409DRAFT_67656 [Zasmidium cellare ATCC 36951]|uniref:L-asparaginase II n=1 Tax=Zasmidium cellare ATCC 36951 TaxID=1080233 RepID=A0A6A6CH23_ZASCE|nr:uncharacterized protein M409DRAFT_67656 [Zasmidium cellare ATCC 36951]KAF2164979.1 hypothetical protein M409DRAFT_67656 [Zasmidium cellare ATCC 36951]